MEENLKEQVDVAAYIKKGFALVNEEKFDELDTLADEMIHQFSSCFWSYCFKAVAIMKVNFIKEVPQIKYQLNQDEIQEDIKARIYHQARWKYASCTQSAYDSISEFYPDVPGEKRGTWNKFETAYDEKLKKITELKANIERVKAQYVKDLELKAKSEKEMAIIHNFKLWGEYIDFAHSELLRYDDDVEKFVLDDAKRTPNPGNKPAFIMHITICILCAFLFLTSLGQSVFLLTINSDTMNVFSMILTITSSVLLAAILVYFLYKTRIFANGNPVLGVVLIVIDLAFVAMAVLSIFFSEAAYWFNLAICIMAFSIFVYTLVKCIQYRPNNTYVTGTYIGNFKALTQNNFRVLYTFAWNFYSTGKEMETATEQEYLELYK